MKKTAYAFLLVLALVFTVLAGYGFYCEINATKMPEFNVKTHSGTEMLVPFIAPDGVQYVFLPSYCEMSDVTLRAPRSITVGDRKITQGCSLADFSAETPYPFSANGQSGTVCFQTSENMPALHITTRSGSMDHIHANKENAESVWIRLYAEDGRLLHEDVAATMKGRGNTTWACRKKPYNLTLSAQAPFMGMGSSDKWVLLANAMDESALSNKIALDLARQSDLGWTPQCEYVELYLNGEYYGLYLLAEKIEAEADKVPIDLSQGEFLATVEPDMRVEFLEHPVCTNQGRLVNITAPEYPTGDEAALIQQLEDAIVSAAEGAFPALVDMDSWAKRYLIDEICANIDADLASSYFYYKDGTFYAGPVWDYDMSFGNQVTNENADAFVAANAVRSRRFATPYDTALLQNKAFYDHVTQLYETQLLPLVQQLLDGGIAQIAQEISVARERNSLRWQEMYEKNPVTTTTAEGMIAYLEKRTAFLSDVWLNGTEYCTVQFELVPRGGACWSISVPVGTALGENFIELGEDFLYLGYNELDEENTQWIEVETKEPFDPKAPITDDILLIQKDPPPAELQEETEKTFSVGSVVAVFLIAVVAVSFLCLVVADCRRRQCKRSRNDE